MLSRLLLAPSLIVAAFVAASVPAQIQLRNALPENTIMYVGMPDIDRSIADMRAMPLLQMWHEEEVQDFFADALKMLDTEFEKALAQGRAAYEQGMLPFDPDSLLKLRVRGFGAAVTTLDIRAGSERGDDPVPHFGMLMQIDFGDTAPAWRNILDFGLNMLEMQARGELTKEETKVGDATLLTFVPPETDMSLNVAFAGNTMVVGSIKSEVVAFLNNASNGTRVLSDSHNFKTTFAQLDGQGVVAESFIQPGPVLDFVVKFLWLASEEAPDFPAFLDIAGIERSIEALGLRSCQAMGFTSVYAPNGDQGNKSVAKSFVYSPEPERKGVFGGGNKELDMEFLKWVPKDAASFNAMTFDLASIYDALIDALTAYDENMAQMMLGQLGMYEDQFGISIKGDLVGAFGNQVISWSMPMAALGTTPEMAILVEVKDQQKLLQTMHTMSSLSDGAFDIDESERRGIKVYQLQINYDPTGGMGINPLDMFIPTFSFKDGYMVAGFSTGDVKRVFKRMDREDNPSGDIRSNTEFAPYLAGLPQSGLNSISFSDWKANFEGIYQMVTSLAAFIPVNDDIPIDLSLLPDVATLTQHLFGSVSWARSDGAGFHGMSQGPWGPETLAILGAGIGAGAFALYAQEEGMMGFRKF